MPTRERKNVQMCEVCDEIFASEEALWSCQSCDHHWGFGEDYCKNCYDSRRKSGVRMYTVRNSPISQWLPST